MKYDTNELLIVLDEELHEAGHVICKTLRFGKESTWNGVSNKERLLQELGDVVAMIEMLIDSTDFGITVDDIKKAKQAKKNKVTTWLKTGV